MSTLKKTARTGERWPSTKIESWLPLPVRWWLTCGRFFCHVTNSFWKPSLFASNSAVFKRKQPRPKLDGLDRLFWIALRRLWEGWSEALIIVKPETVVSWHRAGFRRFWRWRSRATSNGATTGECAERLAFTANCDSQGSAAADFSATHLATTIQAFRMAGSEVTLYGRFWVTPEGSSKRQCHF